MKNSSSRSKPKQSDIVEKGVKDWILNRLENDVLYLISIVLVFMLNILIKKKNRCFNYILRHQMTQSLNL
jgi:hypothetical protein